MTRILSGALFVLLILCLSFIGLSYHFYKQKAEMATQLSVALEVNKNMQESLLISEKRCEIDQAVSKELVEESKAISNESEKQINKISSLPSKSSVKVSNIEKEYVDLDGALPPELTSVLDESCSRAKGSSCVSP